MSKLIYTVTGSVRFEQEDKGAALIAQLDDGEKGLFIRIQSWDPDKVHEQAQQISGKKVRVTIYLEDE